MEPIAKKTKLDLNEQVVSVEENDFFIQNTDMEGQDSDAPDEVEHVSVVTVKPEPSLFNENMITNEIDERNLSDEMALIKVPEKPLRAFLERFQSTVCEFCGQPSKTIEGRVHQSYIQGSKIKII